VVASLAADAILVLHLAFILFVMFGAALVAWRARLAWLHLPALAWGVWISATHGICPLTPLENSLRLAAGEAGYEGSFIDHYLVPVIYPDGLTPAHQNWIAAALVATNVLLYGFALFRARRRSASQARPS
jgi:Protein of Unknown function (DUF2784)